MSNYRLEKDIKVICEAARSFPNDIMGAFDRLKKLVPNSESRTVYGISHMDHGKIIYKAANPESYAGEAEALGAESYIIKAGDYISETLQNWRDNGNIVGDTFQKLLADPRIDPQGACIEWYKENGEMMCMIRIVP